MKQAESGIGDRIRTLRLSQNLKQPDFAKMVGTSASYISEIEAGKKIPGGELLTSIKLKFNNINGNWLLTGQGGMWYSDIPAPRMGWAFAPDSGLQAISWIKKIYSVINVQKVVMISYVERMGTEKGFVFLAADGIYSMAGTATRTDHLGGGRNAYCDILEIIDFHGSPFYKIEFDKSEIIDWAKTDFKELLSSKKIEDKIITTKIYDELRLFKPHLYPERTEYPVAGWSYMPLNTDFSRDWMYNNLNREDVNTIFIISYTNDKGVKTIGFVVNVGSEFISMAGDQAGSHTIFYVGGPDYGHLLAAIEKRGVPLYRLELKDGETLDLRKTDMSSLFTGLDVFTVDIDQELRTINYPEHLREAVMLLKSESAEFIEQVVKLLRDRRADVDKLEKKKTNK